MRPLTYCLLSPVDHSGCPRRIAQGEKQFKLFYPVEDIHVLLGGLAMSQLHVFAGISATAREQCWFSGSRRFFPTGVSSLLF